MTTDGVPSIEPLPHVAAPVPAGAAPGAGRGLLSPDTYLNRELSLIEFNRRVLGEAADPRHPLLERVKFTAIFSSNLDEFFMVRVSGLREQVAVGVAERTPDGMTPVEELAAIRQRLRPLILEQRRILNTQLLPQLRAAGIDLCHYDELGTAEQALMAAYFEREVFPVCTPLAVDPAHPFPHISNLSVNLAVLLEDPDGGRRFARLKVPSVLPRLVALPLEDGRQRFVWLEEVLAANLPALFPGMTLLGAHAFRVVRDADLELQELEAEDLLETIEGALSRRRFGSVVSVSVNPSMPRDLRDLLLDHLQVKPDDVYEVEGPLGLSALMELLRLNRPDLKDGSFAGRTPAGLREGGDLFEAIREGDILLHHPFDSFNPVVDFIERAAADPNVLAIKQTLYRAGRDSPIIEALRTAVERGKQVAVIVELKARFDEEYNIEWARSLEEAGIHVTYGLVGLKTHAKIALVVRKERDGLRRYVHLGTGNYNPSTARTYTDLGLFTCDPRIGADVSELFNYLTGYSKQTAYRRLLVAPHGLRAGIAERIEREIDLQRRGQPGRIIMKMNSLVDPALIELLYRASAAGVRIDLLVRGICCLRPGVPGISESIRVVSFVGRFLEHSRIFYFENGGSPEIFIGSADLMPRNLDRRVETLAPVEDPSLQFTIRHEVLEAYLRDTTRSHLLEPSGSYRRLEPLPADSGGNAVGGSSSDDVQAVLLARALAEAGGSVSPAARAPAWRYPFSQYGRVDPTE